MAVKKAKSCTVLEQDNCHLNQRLSQMSEEVKNLKDELKSVSQQKSGTLLELQQLLKETKTQSRELEEAREKEQLAAKQAEDSEKKVERVTSQFNERIQTLEQDCSRFQIEVFKLQAQMEKKDSIIFEKKEEVRVQTEAIQQLELALSRTKVDCGTRTSNIESALVQSKIKCTALAREVGTMSAEKLTLLSGYEQLKTGLEKASSPQICPNKDLTAYKNDPGLCRKVASETNLMSSISSPSCISAVGQLTMDRDITTVMSDYRRLEQDHQCLLANFQQTVLKIEQLKKSSKQKEAELDSLKTANDTYVDRIKHLEERVQAAQDTTASVQTVVADPESIREVLELKSCIHNLEEDLNDARKQYHARNSDVLEQQAVINRLMQQNSQDSETIFSLESELKCSIERGESLTSALEAKEYLEHRESAAEIGQLQDKLDAVTHDKCSVEDLLESAEKDFDQLQAEFNALQTENLGLTDSYSELKLELERHKTITAEDMRSESLQIKLDAVSSENQQLQCQLEAAKVQDKKVSELEQLLKDKSNSHATLMEDIKTKDAVILELREKLKASTKGKLDKKRVSTLEQKVTSYQKASSQAVDSFRHLLQETECVEKQKFELLAILEEKNDAEGHLHRMVDELKEENHSVGLYVQELEEVGEDNKKSIAELKSALDSLETENENIQALMSEMSTQLQDKEQQLFSSTEQVVSLDNDCKEMEKVLCEFQSECKALESAKHCAEEEVSHMKEALALARDDFHLTSHALSSIRSDYIELQFAQKQLEENNRKLHSTIQLQQEELSHLQQELTVRQDQLVAARNELADTQKRLDKNRSMLEEMEFNLQEQQNDHERKCTDMAETASALQDQVKSLQSDLFAATDSNYELQVAMTEFRDKFTSQSEKNCRLSQDYKHCKDKNERLKYELHRERAVLDKAKRAVLSFSPKTSPRNPAK